MQRFNLCLLCGINKAVRFRVCDACCAELPWLKTGCYQCGMPLSVDIQSGLTLYCGTCLKDPPYFNHVIVPFYYDNPIKPVIKRFKFGHGFYCAPFLRETLLTVIEKDYQRSSLPQVLIPMPLHPNRLKERGFNQAVEISRKIAKKLAIHLDIDSCKRSHHNMPQSGLDAATRRQQKFAWEIHKDFKYQHVAVIDDVMTTGSTVNSLAKELKARGVVRVDVWVCARTL